MLKHKIFSYNLNGYYQVMKIVLCRVQMFSLHNNVLVQRWNALQSEKVGKVFLQSKKLRAEHTSLDMCTFKKGLIKCI